MFCPSCEYDLTGVAAERCPECGRPFDPREPETVGLAPTRAMRIRMHAFGWSAVVAVVAVAWGIVRHETPAPCGLIILTIAVGGVFGTTAGLRMRRVAPSTTWTLVAIAPALGHEACR